ncbi:MAG: DNA-3-methyladenine glycosylase I [Planctomycetaceae bacterium]|jgi:DNA-3-methyladenine glycosylase I|nr:DNA-3-methyladenine glycosylase I [Planctomycetaceae bacterium]
MNIPSKRCEWCGNDPLYVKYHDEEWGVPVFDDVKLFEFLVLEGAQAGLSWITVLRKRENYRKAFAGFNPKKVAAFTAEDIRRLLNDSGIIRNRLKIESAISNAKQVLGVQKEFGSLSNYLWSFVPNNTPISGHWKSIDELPAKTALSDKISKELKRRGFKFVGSTICYSFLQAVGIVNDHIESCPHKKHSK